MLAPRTEIKNRFKNFLRTYVDEKGHNVYKEAIRKMVENNATSLVVNYTHLANEVQVMMFSYHLKLSYIKRSSLNAM